MYSIISYYYGGNRFNKFSSHDEHTDDPRLTRNDHIPTLTGTMMYYKTPHNRTYCLCLLFWNGQIIIEFEILSND